MRIDDRLDPVESPHAPAGSVVDPVVILHMILFLIRDHHAAEALAPQRHKGVLLAPERIDLIELRRADSALFREPDITFRFQE